MVSIRTWNAAPMCSAQPDSEVCHSGIWKAVMQAELGGAALNYLDRCSLFYSLLSTFDVARAI